MKCPNCKAEIEDKAVVAASQRILGRKGRGKRKSRTSEQARAAALQQGCKRWKGPVIFLDFDGVIHDAEKGQFIPAAVTALNRIMRTTGAAIVVSSSWRESMDLDGLRAELDQAGVMGRVIAHTPRSKTKGSLAIATTRGHEIAKWLDTHGGRDRPFVVLDDDTATHPVTENHILTTFPIGLTEAQADRAIDLILLTKTTL